MEVAATILSVVGLSGQALQGCNYLATVFSDAKEAPEVIERVSDELKAIESNLLHFRDFLSELDVNPDLVPDDWNPEAALTCCHRAIDKLKLFVQDFPEMHSPSKSAALNRISKKWQRLKLANNIHSLQRHLSSLQNAKSGLELLQSNIGTRINLRSRLLVDQKLDKIEDSVSSLNVNASQNHMTYIRMHTQLQDFVSHMSQQFGSPSDAFSDRVGSDLAKVLEKHLERMTEQVSAQLRTQVAEESAFNKTTNPLSEKPSLYRADFGPISGSEVVTSAPSTANSYVAKRLVMKSPKKQCSSTIVYDFWVVRIIVETTKTTQKDLSVTESGDRYGLSAKRTNVTIIPNAMFSKSSAFFTMGSTTPVSSHPSWDSRLRVFRTHGYNSPVGQVLTKGDYFEFRNMLERREVTPFDQIEFFHEGAGLQSTLFEYTIDEIHSNGQGWTSGYKRQNKIKILKFLADQGVDCGLGIAMSRVQEMSLGGYEENLVLYLYYLILLNSETDPFTCHYSYEPEKWNIRSFLTQDQWDLCETQDTYEKNFGRGSWQSMVIDKVSRDCWEQSQKDAWCRKFIDLKRSRTYCLSEFGEYFVQYIWPDLCWNEQSPSFWRLSEECRKAFGSSFVECDWPQLSWTKDLPAFWQSREQCEEFFGVYFVEHHWPALYWERKLPTFWRSREECEDFFGERFVRYHWPALYWKQEIPEFHRSREQCKAFFGEHFVKHEWPKLEWKLEVPDFWHSWRACKDAFEEGFVWREWAHLLGADCFEHAFGRRAWNRGWKIYTERFKTNNSFSKRWYLWIARWCERSTQRWRTQNQELRHSRSRTLLEFGLEFLSPDHSNIWPKLLKEDGLTPAEIKELTKDGPDLYFSPPQWPRRNLERSWDEDDGNESDDSGWETAEEELSNTPEEILTKEDYA
ncbi:MAG: hypothetical protein Q9160_001992 [Pyrenula sp. 1 TL-2023]